LTRGGRGVRIGKKERPLNGFSIREDADNIHSGEGRKKKGRKDGSNYERNGGFVIPKNDCAFRAHTHLIRLSEGERGIKKREEKDLVEEVRERKHRRGRKR